MKGLCKIEFEKWYYSLYSFEYISDFDGEINLGLNFDKLPPSMQIGVLIDYFDSVGIDIDQFDWLKIPEYGRTRTEARAKAIEKACELRNKQLK